MDRLGALGRGISLGMFRRCRECDGVGSRSIVLSALRRPFPMREVASNPCWESIDERLQGILVTNGFEKFRPRIWHDVEVS